MDGRKPSGPNCQLLCLCFGVKFEELYRRLA